MTIARGGRNDEVLAVGVDGCPDGWVAAIARADRGVEIKVFRTINDLVRELRGRGARVIAVDMPIGLPDTPQLRRCDREAREVLGKAKSSVFPVPDRELISLSTWEEVQEVVAAKKKLDPEAKGISKQSYAISPKIAELDAFVRANPDCHSYVVEVHPEVSFRAMSDREGELPKKKSDEGKRARKALLAEHLFGRGGLRHPGDDMAPSGANRDDVLDAFAALWTAQRFLAQDSFVLGGDLDAHGVPMRMVV